MADLEIWLGSSCIINDDDNYKNDIWYNDVIDSYNESKEF